MFAKLTRLARALAVQDWLALVYVATLLGFTIAGEGPRRTTALLGLAPTVLGFVLALLLTRAPFRADDRPLLDGGICGAIVYRLGLFGTVFGTFADLQYILPTARTVRVDAGIYAFDKALFGFEPAESFDRFVTTGTTEWFSFFYFGYFFILAVHVFPFMFAVVNKKMLGEISLGLIALFCIGQALYIAVPGYGPYQHLAGHFTHELDGPTWWRLVRTTVDAGEVTARTDIFPSLHTAAPTYLALFAFRHRKTWPFRVTWIPMAFFASQIVISTMFLRWHYLVDVIAGLALAGAISFAAARVSQWEARKRELAGIEPVFTAPWIDPFVHPTVVRLVHRLGILYSRLHAPLFVRDHAARLDSARDSIVPRGVQ